jgi:tetratricopeptide (TPR) repeat protein
MPPIMRNIVAFVAFVGGALVMTGRAGWAAPELEPDTLPVPPVPVAAGSGTLQLPTVPSFELPPEQPGVHQVRELRVRGRRLLGSRIVVAGYVTWIYDCVKAVTKPGMSIVEVQERIDDNPGLCERPKFYLGASPTAAPETTVQVVDVPRPANKRERIALTPVQLRNRPAVPTLQVGDFVAVTGVFALSSPYGEQSSEGLVVYGGLKHLEQGTPSAPASAPVGAAPTTAAAGESSVVSAPAMRVVVPMWKRNESIDHYERCNQALVAGHQDDAVTECRQAVALWDGNHLAWYALANAHAAKEHWRAARDAYEHAARLRPDQAMYQLYAGIAMYKLALGELGADEARGAEAPADPVSALRAIERDPAVVRLALKPARLAAALSQLPLSRAVRFERARQALSAAVTLAPELALGHYYLGQVHRELDDLRAEATSLTRAVQADPSQPAAYIALAELYRSWDYIDRCLAVAQQGVAHANPSANANLWYELGMAHKANGHNRDAIAAFSHAVRGGNVQAMFQRGQILFRREDLESAKRDLEAFVGSPASHGVARNIASGLLFEIARRQATTKAYLRMPTRMDPKDDRH